MKQFCCLQQLSLWLTDKFKLWNLTILKISIVFQPLSGKLPMFVFVFAKKLTRISLAIVLVAGPYETCLLVDLALAERFCCCCCCFVGSSQTGGLLPAFLTETLETGDKNYGYFHCMQMSSWWAGDDWIDAPCSTVPVRAVKRNLRSRRDCARYPLSSYLCLIKRCYDKKAFDADRS